MASHLPVMDRIPSFDAPPSRLPPAPPPRDLASERDLAPGPPPFAFREAGGWTVEKQEFRRVVPHDLDAGGRARWLREDLFRAGHATGRRVLVGYWPPGMRDGLFHARETQEGQQRRSFQSDDADEVWRVVRAWMLDSSRTYKATPWRAENELEIPMHRVP